MPSVPLLPVRPKLTLYVNKGSDACKWWVEEVASVAVQHVMTVVMYMSTLSLLPYYCMCISIWLTTSNNCTCLNNLCSTLVSFGPVFLLSYVLHSVPGHLLEQNKCLWVGWEAVRQVQLWAIDNSQHRTVCMHACTLVDCLFTLRDAGLLIIEHSVHWSMLVVVCIV